MRFFRLRIATGLKILGAVIPRRVFTQPGSSAAHMAGSVHGHDTQRYAQASCDLSGKKFRDPPVACFIVGTVRRHDAHGPVIRGLRL